MPPKRANQGFPPVQESVDQSKTIEQREYTRMKEVIVQFRIARNACIACNTDMGDRQSQSIHLPSASERGGAIICASCVRNIFNPAEQQQQSGGWGGSRRAD
jgi:hypothetical protein